MVNDADRKSNLSNAAEIFWIFSLWKIDIGQTFVAVIHIKISYQLVNKEYNNAMQLKRIKLPILTVARSLLIERNARGSQTPNNEISMIQSKG